MMTFRKDWIEELASPRWCRAVESSLGIRKQESCSYEQERNKNMDIFNRKRISELEDELEKIRCSKDKLEKYVKEYEVAIGTLNNGIKSLTDEINAKVSDCKVGEWCKDCKYHSVARIGNLEGIKERVINPWIDWDAKYSKYYYCLKHLREICPEFKKDEEE